MKSFISGRDLLVSSKDGDLWITEKDGESEVLHFIGAGLIRQAGTYDSKKGLKITRVSIEFTEKEVIS